MAVYTSPARAIHARLTASSALGAVLTGGIWDRPLARKGPKATTTAFATTSPHQLLPSAVVPDAGEEADGVGPRGSFLGFPLVYFYADDDANGTGRLAIEQAIEIARGVLSGWTYTTVQGTGVEIAVAGRFGSRADPADETRWMDYLRLQADGLWQLEG